MIYGGNFSGNFVRIPPSFKRAALKCNKNEKFVKVLFYRANGDIIKATIKEVFL